VATSNQIANQALQLSGNNQPIVTGNAPNFDSSPAGITLSYLYPWAVRTIGRQFNWDFSRSTATLSASGNTPPIPWTYEYIYPPNAVQVWQLLAAASLTNVNNPLPVNWVVANNLVSAVQTKVIQTNLASALAVYDNLPAEGTWDPGFQEAVVRLLASELAMGLDGRPETAQNYYESSAQISGFMQGRRD
jgi:hypothetical protein